mgnify:CR=1 FL=1
MPGKTPLYNAFAQNSLDLNNQTASNNAGFSRFNVASSGATSLTLSAANFNTITVFSDNVDITIQSVTGLNPGAEAIIMSSGGRVYFIVNGVSVYADDNLFYSEAINKPVRLTYMGGTAYSLSGMLAKPMLYTTENCCSISVEVYQLVKAGYSFSVLGGTLYADSTCKIKYNGDFYENLTRYQVTEGVAADIEGSCFTSDYSTAYGNFYGVPTVDDTPVSLYSVSGLSPGNSPSAFVSNKVFTSSVGVQYDCYTTNQYSGVKYYKKPAGDNSVHYCEFLNGYLIKHYQI